MIIYPKKWNRDYAKDLDSIDPMIFVDGLQELLLIAIDEIKVMHLAYSGGIDSTIMLAEMTKVFGSEKFFGDQKKGKIHTYTLSSREDHPDMIFARQGAELYGSIHHEFIVKPEAPLEGDNPGDNIVRQFFNEISEHTSEIICGDGIDEYMCGYYDHMADPDYYYSYYLSRLNSGHLVPLDEASGEVFVYLPYLEPHIVSLMLNIDLEYKVSSKERKKLMVLWAKKLNIPDKFISRNKYGFVDAFREKDK